MDNYHDIEGDFVHRASTPSDINEHLPVLRALAAECGTVVEFGVRTGNSTCALLAGLHDRGRESTLISYDKNQPSCQFGRVPRVHWIFQQADTAHLPEIPLCDMLFIDTLHTFSQVKEELRHAGQVGRYLVFHDTVLFGFKDEQPGQGPGIMQAILAFLAWGKWRVSASYPNNNGLLVLERV